VFRVWSMSVLGLAYPDSKDRVSTGQQPQAVPKFSAWDSGLITFRLYVALWLLTHPGWLLTHPGRLLTHPGRVGNFCRN
jgi:hypothetical protein